MPDSHAVLIAENIKLRDELAQVKAALATALKERGLYLKHAGESQRVARVIEARAERLAEVLRSLRQAVINADADGRIQPYMKAAKAALADRPAQESKIPKPRKPGRAKP